MSGGRLSGGLMSGGLMSGGLMSAHRRTRYRNVMSVLATHALVRGLMGRIHESHISVL